MRARARATTSVMIIINRRLQTNWLHRALCILQLLSRGKDQQRETKLGTPYPADSRRSRQSLLRTNSPACEGAVCRVSQTQAHLSPHRCEGSGATSSPSPSPPRGLPKQMFPSFPPSLHHFSPCSKLIHTDPRRRQRAFPGSPTSQTLTTKRTTQDAQATPKR